MCVCVCVCIHVCVCRTLSYFRKKLACRLPHAAAETGLRLAFH